MRVTNKQLTKNFIDQIFAQRLALEQSRSQVATGLRVVNPSDDPGRASTIAQYQNTLQRLERHTQRIAYAGTLLSEQEQTLNASEDVLVRAKEIATQAANGTSSAEVREQMATEVFHLRDQLVALANTKVQGLYIYGGADDDDAPFDADTYTDPADADDPAHTRYVFDDEDGTELTREVQITDTDSVRILTSGDEVFSKSISALERLGRALAGYRTTPEDLSTLPDGGGAAFSLPAQYTAQTQAILETIDEIEDGRVEIVTEISDVGGRVKRIEEAQQIINSVRSSTEQVLSSIKDVDVIEAATNFSNLQVTLQATLASGARINGLTLLDFI